MGGKNIHESRRKTLLAQLRLPGRSRRGRAKSRDGRRRSTAFFPSWSRAAGALRPFQPREEPAQLRHLRFQVEELPSEHRDRGRVLLGLRLLQVSADLGRPVSPKSSVANSACLSIRSFNLRR